MTKRKLLSIVLALALLVSLLPMAALAEDVGGGQAEPVEVEAKSWDELAAYVINDDTAVKITLTGNAIAGEESGSLEIPEEKTVEIDLNGHKIDGQKKVEDVITVKGMLTLTDSSDDQTGVITGGTYDGVWVDYDEETEKNGTFIMEGGTISGNGDGEHDDTCGVYVDGDFTMTGGTISGNAVNGVYVYGGGVFAMAGGTISGNGMEVIGDIDEGTPISKLLDEMKETDTPKDLIEKIIDGKEGDTSVMIPYAVSGCGVNLDGASFLMTGGTIESNGCPGAGYEILAEGIAALAKDATYQGPEAKLIVMPVGIGVNADDSDFIMTGGTIRNNGVGEELLYDLIGVRDEDNCGVCVDEDGTFTMYGGTISGNGAGGVLAMGEEFSMPLPSTFNASYDEESHMLTVNGEDFPWFADTLPNPKAAPATITGNKGFGVAATGESFTMHAGSISDNAFIGLVSIGNATVTGGAISNNGYVGAISISRGESGSFNMYGGAISGNGLGVVNVGVGRGYTASLNVFGGTVSGNVIGAVNAGYSQFNLANSAKLSNNTVGAINGAGSTFNMDDNAVISNGVVGAVNVPGGVFNMDGGEITGQTKGAMDALGAVMPYVSKTLELIPDGMFVLYPKGVDVYDENEADEKAVDPQKLVTNAAEVFSTLLVEAVPIIQEMAGEMEINPDDYTGIGVMNLMGRFNMDGGAISNNNYGVFAMDVELPETSKDDNKDALLGLPTESTSEDSGFFFTSGSFKDNAKSDGFLKCVEVPEIEKDKDGKPTDKNILALLELGRRVKVDLKAVFGGVVDDIDDLPIGRPRAIRVDSMPAAPTSGTTTPTSIRPAIGLTGTGTTGNTTPNLLLRTANSGTGGEDEGKAPAKPHPVINIVGKLAEDTKISVGADVPAKAGDPDRVITEGLKDNGTTANFTNKTLKVVKTDDGEAALHYVVLEGIKLEPDGDYIIDQDAEVKLKLTFDPADASNKNVTLTVEPSDILSAVTEPQENEDGSLTYTFTGLKAGTATVTAKVVEGEQMLESSCQVIVNAKKGSDTPSYGGGTPTHTVKVETKTSNGSVKASPSEAAAGTEVKLTVTPDEGWELDELKVTDSSGAEVPVTKNSDGTWSFTMPAKDVTVTATFKQQAGADPCAAFTDLDPDAWYHDGVHYALEKGYMQGEGNGIFNPGGITTRAVAAQLLWNMAGKPEATATIPFADVKADDWFAKAVAWAAEQEVVEGWIDQDSGERVFHPNDPVTREQFATMLYRFAKLNGLGFTGLWSFRLDFPDVADVSDWAMEAISWMVMNGIMNGMDGLLQPQGKSTRAQIATMIMRYDAVKK